MDDFWEGGETKFCTVNLDLLVSSALSVGAQVLWEAAEGTGIV